MRRNTAVTRLKPYEMDARTRTRSRRRRPIPRMLDVARLLVYMLLSHIPNREPTTAIAATHSFIHGHHRHAPVLSTRACHPTVMIQYVRAAACTLAVGLRCLRSRVSVNGQATSDLHLVRFSGKERNVTFCPTLAWTTPRALWPPRSPCPWVPKETSWKAAKHTRLT